MIKLNPKLKLWLIIKRGMMRTSTEEFFKEPEDNLAEKPTTPNMPNQPPRRHLIDNTSDDDNEIQVEPNAPPLPPTVPAPTNVPVLSMKDQVTQLFSSLTPEQKEQYQKNQDEWERNQANGTYDELPSKTPLYTPPDLSTEAFMTNVAYQTFVANIVAIDEKLNLQIKRSAELANDWKVHIEALDKYIASLKTLPWRKILTYSACLLTIGAFIWKMGLLRAIPNFMSGIITNLPTTTVNSSKDVAQDLSVPKVNLQAVLDTPLTPIGIVLGVGTLSISWGIIYTVAWAIKKLPK